MFLCSVVDGLNNSVLSINSRLLSSTLSTLLLSSYFRFRQASLSLSNTCSYKRKEGTSLHVVQNHWRLNLLLCYTCIANKGLQGAMKSWWKVSLLISGSSGEVLHCKEPRSKTAELQFDEQVQSLCSQVTQVAADCDCSPHILFTTKALMVSLLLLIMLEMFPLPLSWTASEMQFFSLSIPSKYFLQSTCVCD